MEVPVPLRQGVRLTAPQLRWPWRYAGEAGGRDSRLDFLRGWCLFSMVVDHAVGDQHNTFVLKVTGGGGYPMTGAHGFVFLSGTVFGLLYGRILAREGWSSALPKALGRAFKLYLVAVALGLLTLAFGVTPWGGSSPLADLLSIQSLIQTLLLHGANDSLMTLYFLLVITAPIALFLMQRGLSWLVIGISLGLWLGHLYVPRYLGNPLEIFVPAAEWQILFVTGLLIGYHRRTLAAWLRGRKRQLYLLVLFSLFSGLVALQIAFSTEHVDDPLSAWLVGQIWTDYDHNPPLHMLAIFVTFLALFHVVDWVWVPVKRLVGWFLIPMGQAALYVYIVHVVLVYFLLLNIPIFASLDGFWLGIVLLGFMLVLWVMVKTRFLYSIVPR